MTFSPRCAEQGVRLWTVSIFDLPKDRLYRLYLDIHRSPPTKDLLLPRTAFLLLPEVRAVVKEADKLSRRKLRPATTPKKRKPELWNLLKRIVAAS